MAPFSQVNDTSPTIKSFHYISFANLVYHMYTKTYNLVQLLIWRGDVAVQSRVHAAEDKA